MENKLEGTKEIVKDTQEYLPTEPIENPAYIGVSAGATIGLANYSSGRINISISYPCDPAKIDEVYPKLKDWVDKRVGEEVSELRQVTPTSKSVDI